MSEAKAKENVHQKLLHIIGELKAPKNQRNNFGGYNYRSAEDILEAVKPLLVKYGAVLNASEDVVLVGTRYYVKSTVTIINADDPTDRYSNTGFAREEETKKGMDGSQITGASTSYAKKYALNDMFCIDDTKDSDATNTHGKDAPKPAANAAQILAAATPNPQPKPSKAREAWTLYVKNPNNEGATNEHMKQGFANLCKAETGKDDLKSLTDSEWQGVIDSIRKFD